MFPEREDSPFGGGPVWNWRGLFPQRRRELAREENRLPGPAACLSGATATGVPAFELPARPTLRERAGFQLPDWLPGQDSNLQPFG